VNLVALNPWHVLDPSAHRGHRFYRENEVEWLPPVDVYEGDTGYTLLMDLPGFTKQNVDIQIENQHLNIVGVRSPPDNFGKLKYAERVHGKFVRRFTIPADADETGIKASFECGVMFISIPKQAKLLPKKILIESKN